MVLVEFVFIIRTFLFGTYIESSYSFQNVYPIIKNMITQGIHWVAFSYYLSVRIREFIQSVSEKKK
jgi:hypothetical protein